MPALHLVASAVEPVSSNSMMKHRGVSELLYLSQCFGKLIQTLAPLDRSPSSPAGAFGWENGYYR